MHLVSPAPELDPFGDLFPSTKQDGAKSFDLTNLADSLAESCKERKDCKTPEAFLGPAASSLVNLDSLVAPPQAAKTRNPFLSGRSWGARAMLLGFPKHWVGEGRSGWRPKRRRRVWRMRSRLDAPRLDASPCLLAGLSTPSPTNPFSLAEQPKPTLNQMRTSSPVPGLPAGLPVNAMTYSASLPLPLSSVPAALPASASAFPQAGAGPFPELPSTLPQPLLPLSGPPAPPASQGGLNPFL